MNYDEGNEFDERTGSNGETNLEKVSSKDAAIKVT